MFLPVKSVGVMGDGRTYDYVVALRAVQTSDFMTADWAELPYALLKKVSSRIINEVRGINRVDLRRLEQAAGDDRVGMSPHRPAVFPSVPSQPDSTVGIRTWRPTKFLRVQRSPKRPDGFQVPEGND